MIPMCYCFTVYDSVEFFLLYWPQPLIAINFLLPLTRQMRQMSLLFMCQILMATVEGEKQNSKFQISLCCQAAEFWILQLKTLVLESGGLNHNNTSWICFFWRKSPRDRLSWVHLFDQENTRLIPLVKCEIRVYLQSMASPKFLLHRPNLNKEQVPTKRPDWLRCTAGEVAWRGSHDCDRVKWDLLTKSTLAWTQPTKPWDIWDSVFSFATS